MDSNQKGRMDVLAAQGISLSWLQQMLTQYGPDILKLIEDALTLGFTPAVIQEAVTLGGKILLGIMVGHLQAVRASKQQA